MTAELIALTEELRATRAMLSVVVARLDDADRRARRHRMGTVLLALCVAAITLLGVAFYRAEQDDDQRACFQSNEARDDIRHGIVSTVVKVIERRGDDPESFQPLIDDITTDLEKTLPDRNC